MMTQAEPMKDTKARRGRRRTPPETRPLLDEMLDLVRRAHKRVSRRTIAEGAGVDYDWLNMVAQGRIRNPGVQHVQRVRDYLAARVDDLAEAS